MVYDKKILWDFCWNWMHCVRVRRLEYVFIEICQHEIHILCAYIQFSNFNLNEVFITPPRLPSPQNY